MVSINTVWFRAKCVIAMVIACVCPCFAATYPLEIINIRPGDTAGVNRLSRAYPGIEYNVRVVVIGGIFPYTFSLSSGPEDMQIDTDTGVVSWLRPVGRATPTVAVTDREGTRVVASWTIEVTKAGFRFIDAASGHNAAGNGCNSMCGTGTIENPWRTIGDLHHSASEPGQIAYFRAGTYRLDDVPRSRRSIGTPWERVEFEESRRAVVWLGFPGEKPMIDFGYRDGGPPSPLIRFEGRNVYIDNFDVANSHVIGFQIAAYQTGATIRRVSMRNHGTAGLDGSNAAMIMTLTTPTVPKYMVVQNCEFITTKTVAVKIYAQEKMLIEDSVFQDVFAGIALKDDARQFTVRRNTFRNVHDVAIGGNMHEATTTGEILFNNVASAATALELNRDGMAGRIEVSRNTLVGRVEVRNTDAASGPFYFTGNVIVNSDRSRARIAYENVRAPERIVVTDNLVGSPSDRIVDASGNLTPAYAKYRGSRGQ